MFLVQKPLIRNLLMSLNTCLLFSTHFGEDEMSNSYDLVLFHDQSITSRWASQIFA